MASRRSDSFLYNPPTLILLYACCAIMPAWSDHFACSESAQGLSLSNTHDLPVNSSVYRAPTGHYSQPQYATNWGSCMQGVISSVYKSSAGHYSQQLWYNVR